MNFISITNGMYSFKKGKRLLENINLTLQRGSLTLIEGYTGSGKTTLLNMLSGILEPLSGYVTWGDNKLFHDIQQREIDRLRNGIMGVVFADYRLVHHLSGKENILLPSIIGKSSVDNEIVNELSSAFFWKEFNEEGKNLLERPVHTLSYGQQERVAVLRAFSTAPPFVLADEMFSSINPDLKSVLWKKVKEICRVKNIGLLLVTHDSEIIHHDPDFDKRKIDANTLK